MKIVKGLLQKTGGVITSVEFREALLAWRVTPRSNGFSPAFGFFGRNLRTRLPTVRGALDPNAASEFHQARLATDRAAVHAAKGHHLPLLSVGQLVHYQHPIDGNWCLGGVIKSICNGARSYIIETPSGPFRRNRRFLRPASIVTPNDLSPVPNIIHEKSSPQKRRGERIRKKTVHFQS